MFRTLWLATVWALESIQTRSPLTLAFGSTFVIDVPLEITLNPEPQDGTVSQSVR